MKKTLFLFVALSALLLAACANQQPATALSSSASAPAKPALEFIDVASFDRELGNSLAAKLPSVNVAVVSSTSATAMPERLQTWLHAVEASGGTVTVSPPKSTVAAKNPLLLFSLVSGVWNSIKVSKAIQTYETHKPARTYDAEIVLKISEQGDRLIDKIIFTERKPA
jgi:hypothetical protein